MQVANIEDWGHLNELEKIHIQNQSYMNLLLYFLENKTEINDEHYQYYQKKYLDSYFELDSLKEQFVNYLKQSNIIKEQDKIEWNINFLTKEVYINEID